ncbi:MAG TPA: RHS repeat-associated core domain-containing protein [Ktedonobacterales bacterium]
MAYDGEGNRVALVVNGGTPTYYLGSLEEVSGGKLTKYLTSGLSGLPVAERVGANGTLSYLVSDGLGSMSEVLSSSGTATFQQLFTPYGSLLYSSGTPPTSFAFTGQRSDSASGLDYYNARYYDPVARQFAISRPASAVW